MDHTEAFLVLKDFSCGYRPSFQLANISFSVSKGSFAGIIGPNGSGKTTLLKGISGELQKLGGELSLMGQSTSVLSLKERARHFAVVSQFSASADISVEEYVIMGRMPYRTTWQFFETAEDISIAERYMELTHIDHLRHKRITQLSGGELQLASIARALTQEPEILLLDEPTSHLDISHQVQILNLIQQLNTELGLTVLMVIHDLNLAGEYCDHLFMMKEGDLYTSGAPGEVLLYNHIEAVYNTVVITRENPLSGKPAIFLVSGRVLKNL
ncbi:MAG: ABC transporter ATP-binding protein [Bacteroidota bacterium]